MKQFVKESTGLVASNPTKIKVYNSVDDAVSDIDNLEVGDIVASKLVEGAADIAEAQQIISDEVNEITALIPNDASVTNKLVAKSDLDEVKDLIPNGTTVLNKLVNTNILYQIIDTIEPVGTIKAVGAASGWDTAHWALCDGTNGTPDLREVTLKGVGQNTQGASHKALSLLEFQDDQIQNITGETRNLGMAWTSVDSTGAITTTNIGGYGYNGYGQGVNNNGIVKMSFDASKVARTGTTTEVKAVGVNFIIKIANYA